MHKEKIKIREIHFSLQISMECEDGINQKVNKKQGSNVRHKEVGGKRDYRARGEREVKLKVKGNLKP